MKYYCALMKPGQSFVAACLQMQSGDCLDDNLRRAGRLVQRAADAGARLVALPECFPLMSADEGALCSCAEDEGGGPVQDALAHWAAQHRLHLVGGTIALRAAGRPRAACLFYGPDGRLLARYDKMHLFGFGDAHDEARHYSAGDAAVAVDTDLGRIGLAVCYDLRFPELFRAMGEPDIIVAPSAFTVETGQAHWELLCRARAVENMAHLIAPAQGGEHPGGRRTFGHALAVDPWGGILARAAAAGDALLLAQVDAGHRQRLRLRLPCLQARRIR